MAASAENKKCLRTKYRLWRNMLRWCCVLSLIAFCSAIYFCGAEINLCDLTEKFEYSARMRVNICKLLFVYLQLS